MKPVSGKRMCQVLESHGWRLARISGSHHIYRHPEVPVHGNLDLNDEQIRRFYFYAVTMLRIHEEMYRQRREGMIAANRWKTTERTLAGVMTSPGYQACFSSLRGSLDKEFAELIDEMIETSPAAASYDLAAEWRDGVRRAISGGKEKKA